MDYNHSSEKKEQLFLQLKKMHQQLENHQKTIETLEKEKSKMMSQIMEHYKNLDY
ncbi:hypothetical protein OF864_00090 [Bacillus cereus]|uniref:hypothetical protein n=1 Tax=Bacillus TaxID=1386 RepID=UPI001F5CFCAE|nr:hypothetical protein [Bacillus cereus]WHS75864.1 hypothetical protein OF864_00090 [Bacillus cereus]